MGARTDKTPEICVDEVCQPVYGAFNNGEHDMTCKYLIQAPKTMIEGWRVWVYDNGKRIELSQVNGDGHGAAFRSAFDSREKAVKAVRNFYRRQMVPA